MDLRRPLHVSKLDACSSGSAASSASPGLLLRPQGPLARAATTGLFLSLSISVIHREKKDSETGVPSPYGQGRQLTGTEHSASRTGYSACSVGGAQRLTVSIITVTTVPFNPCHNPPPFPGLPLAEADLEHAAPGPGSLLRAGKMDMHCM